MKKEILEALKTKFAGVQDAILNRIAEKLAKTVTDADGVATAIEGVTFQQVLESYGDSRATEATQSAVTNYEKKHGIKDGAKLDKKTDGGDEPPAEQPEQGGNAADEVPAWAKALIEQNKKLEERLAGFEGDRVANTRLEKLSGAIKSAPEKIRERYSKDFSRMTFQDEEEFDSWIQEVQTDVNDIVNDLESKGAVFSPPKGGASGSSDDKPSAEVLARAERNKAETVIPAIKGLPETK